MNFSASDIAAMVGGAVEGNPAVEVGNFAKIEKAKAGDITFLANPKYEPDIYTTGASIVLVRRDFVPQHPVQATLIRVDDPYATLAHLLQAVDKLLNQHPVGIEQPSHIADGVTIPDDCYVGAFAYIAPGVTLGRGVKIYPQTFIGRGVSLGEGTIVYPGVKIYQGVVVGKRCIIHSGAVIGADGFGFAPDADGTYTKIPQLGIVEIADDVEIGANTTIDRATMGATRIGRGTKLDNLIQIAHNVEVGHDTVMASQCGVAGSAKIGSHCMIAGQVGFAGHITVGDNVTIGAQSGIPGNVRPGSRLMGYPAVPAGDFARQAVYIKNLASLFNRVAQIEKSLDK